MRLGWGGVVDRVRWWINQWVSWVRKNLWRTEEDRMKEGALVGDCGNADEWVVFISHLSTTSSVDLDSLRHWEKHSLTHAPTTWGVEIKKKNRVHSQVWISQSYKPSKFIPRKNLPAIAHKSHEPSYIKLRLRTKTCSFQFTVAHIRTHK